MNIIELLKEIEHELTVSNGLRVCDRCEECDHESFQMDTSALLGKVEAELQKLSNLDKSE